MKAARVRRAAVLDDLVALFSAAGFSSMTLDDLAAQLRCSKTTLYAIAPSKEQLVVKVVVEFFRAAAERVEEKLSHATGSLERVHVYLRAVTAELETASRAFMVDIAEFVPARAVYEHNTALAAARVRNLVNEGAAAGDFRGVDASFVGVALSVVMTAICRGEVAAATGLRDADAYEKLAEVVLYGITERGLVGDHTVQS